LRNGQFSGQSFGHLNEHYAEIWNFRLIEPLSLLP